MNRDAGYRSYRMMLVGIVAVQAVLSLLSIGVFLLDVTGIYVATISWNVREMLQLLTILGLGLGTFLGMVLLRDFVRQRRESEARLRAAAGEFNALMWQRFDEWGLTPAEADVAMFAIKGFSNTEIAGLRGKSVGTIKAQSNSVFRKAGVTGRPQLIGLLIEDLSEGIGAMPEPARSAIAS